MTVLTRLPFVAVPLALGLIVTIELLCVVWIMSRQLKEYTKQTVVLEEITAALSRWLKAEDISNPHASPELLRLVGDYPFESPVPPASHPRHEVKKLSLGGYNK
ncbi:MAG: hypothetical protein ACLQOO_27760 [Terriglobia bacterium]